MVRENMVILGGEGFKKSHSALTYFLSGISNRGISRKEQFSKFSK